MIAPRQPVDSPPLDNERVARRLEEVADLLEAQDANPFRVRAYRNAAATVRGLDRPAHAILRKEGLKGLTRLPGIGDAMARTIEQLALTGRFGLLEKLEGEAGPEALLATLPGIGPELAGRIHERLGVATLPDLERAAHDGRLQEVPGLGPKRTRAIREALAGRLRRRPHPRERDEAGAERPPVSELLDVDREYREKAEAGKLRRIAPRRFNPRGEAWLPVLHAHRGERHYTALFSNTAQAHKLGTTRAWVVIYLDDGRQDQWTVITAKSGPLRGRRVVRGREQECAGYYAGEGEGGRSAGEQVARGS
jgi:DNA polymerase (family X)